LRRTLANAHAKSSVHPLPGAVDTPSSEVVVVLVVVVLVVVVVVDALPRRKLMALASAKHSCYARGCRRWPQGSGVRSVC
jgi:hypothetical protein